MVKRNFLTKMLLLCALIVGSGSVWAEEITSTFTSSFGVGDGEMAWTSSKSGGSMDSNGRGCGFSKAGTYTLTAQNQTNYINQNIRKVILIVSSNAGGNTISVKCGDTDLKNNGENTASVKNANNQTIEFVGDVANNATIVVTINNPNSNQGKSLWTKSITVVYNPLGPSAEEPASVGTTPVVWDFSSASAQSASGTITESTTNTLTATDGTSTIKYVAGSKDKYNTSSGAYYLKPNGGSAFSSNLPTNRYFILQISKPIVLAITSNSTKPGEYKIYQANEEDASKSTLQTSITTGASNLTASGVVDNANGEYVFIAFNGQLYTEKLSLAEYNAITITTTDNMDGWRSFYDATQDYEVDDNTKIYVVKAKSTKDNVVELTALDATKVKAGTPVILKTSATDHKLVLTKTTGADDLGDNLLAFAASTAVDGYRMGYKSTDGIGFYKYTATAPASGVVYIGKDNVVSSAHEFLAFSFDNETTGIANLNVDVNDNFDANAPMYNLAGQRVNKNYKGVIIQNGRKYLNK